MLRGVGGCVVVSDKESLLICIRAVEVLVKLVKCYCLGRVPLILFINTGLVA